MYKNEGLKKGCCLGCLFQRKATRDDVEQVLKRICLLEERLTAVAMRSAQLRHRSGESPERRSNMQFKTRKKGDIRKEICTKDTATSCTGLHKISTRPHTHHRNSPKTTVVTRRIGDSKRDLGDKCDKGKLSRKISNVSENTIISVVKFTESTNKLPCGCIVRKKKSRNISETPPKISDSCLFEKKFASNGTLGKFNTSNAPVKVVKESVIEGKGSGVSVKKGSVENEFWEGEYSIVEKECKTQNQESIPKQEIYKVQSEIIKREIPINTDGKTFRDANTLTIEKEFIEPAAYDSMETLPKIKDIVRNELDPKHKKTTREMATYTVGFDEEYCIIRKPDKCQFTQTSSGPSYTDMSSVSSGKEVPHEYHLARRVRYHYPLANKPSNRKHYARIPHTYHHPPPRTSYREISRPSINDSDIARCCSSGQCVHLHAIPSQNQIPVHPSKPPFLINEAHVSVASSNKPSETSTKSDASSVQGTAIRAPEVRRKRRRTPRTGLGHRPQRHKGSSKPHTRASQGSTAKIFREIKEEKPFQIAVKAGKGNNRACYPGTETSPIRNVLSTGTICILAPKENEKEPLAITYEPVSQASASTTTDASFGRELAVPCKSVAPHRDRPCVHSPVRQIPKKVRIQEFSDQHVSLFKSP